MVADFKVGFEVNLHSVANNLGARARYKPLKFPGCRVTSSYHNKQKALIYLSGKNVLTGLKSRIEIMRLQRETYQICCENRYNQTGSVSKKEFRLIETNKHAEQENLDVINHKLKYLSLPFENSKRKCDGKTKRLEISDGRSYIRSVNPLNPLLLSQSKYTPLIKCN